MKADPQVLLRPKVEVSRIGDTLYVRSLEGAIKIEGFEEERGFLYRREEKPFCFTVKRVSEGKEKYCVEEALKGVPEVSLSYAGYEVVVRARGYKSYALYTLVEDHRLDPLTRRSVGESFRLKRGYSKTCYALTGVEGRRETYPHIFCLEPLPPSQVKDVENLEYRTTHRLLILVWSYENEYHSFFVYKDGELLGETKGFSFEIELPKGRTTFTVKVKSKEGFISKGRSITYSP